MMSSLRAHASTAFGESLLRGAGQVVFQNNPVSGALVLIGIAIGSWTAPIDFLIGAALATATAMLLKADRSKIDDGLFAFTGGYAGLMIGAFAAPEVRTNWLELAMFLSLGGILAVPLMAGLSVPLKKLGLSPLALPVVLLLWLLMAGYFYTDLPGRYAVPQLLVPPSDEPTAYSFATAYHSGLNGLSQVFILKNPITGALVLVAIVVNSRLAGVVTIASAAVAFAVAWLFRFPEETARSGVVSFNAILCGVAVGGLFLRLTWYSFIYALVGAALSLWAFVALSIVLAPTGLPASTMPFVLITWLLVLSAHTTDTLEPIALDDVTRPEGHTRWQLGSQSPRRPSVGKE